MPLYSKRGARRAAVLSSLACAVVVALPGVALADPSAADTAAARSLGVEGFKLAAAGNCAEAVDRVARSEALHHAVSVLEKLGECQLKVGKIVDGVESLRRAARERLAPDAPPAYIAAQEEAKRALADATRRLAHVNISVSGPPTSAVSVTIDGTPMATASLNTDWPIDPGDHVIAASAPGFLSATSTVHSVEGGSNPVALTLKEGPHETPPPPAAGASAAPVAAVPLQPPPPPAASSHTAAYVVGGVGIAGLAVGVAGGLIALGDKSSLSSACHNGACPESSASTLSGGQTAGTVSTVGFIVGGVGLAAGVTLYFVHLGGSATDAAPAAHAYLGPGSAGVVGSF